MEALTYDGYLAYCKSHRWDLILPIDGDWEQDYKTLLVIDESGF